MFLISSTFEAEDSPLVNSFTLFNINGVIFAPLIPYTSDSLIAWVIAFLISSTFGSLSLGIGLANIIPVFNYIASFKLFIRIYGSYFKNFKCSLGIFRKFLYILNISYKESS